MKLILSLFFCSLLISTVSAFAYSDDIEVFAFDSEYIGVTTETVVSFNMSNVTDLWVNETGDTMSGNLDVNANVTADFFFGDGSQLTNIPGDNSSWNETYANTLYATEGDNSSWNETYAYTLFANITDLGTYTSSYEFFDDATSYYSMNETSGTTSNDLIGSYDGNGNNANIFSGAFAGIQGTDADFTGGSYYIDYGDIAWIDNTNQLTLSYWVNQSNFNERGSHVVKSAGSTNEDTVFITHNLNGHRFKAQFRSVEDVDYGIEVDGSLYFLNNTWSNVVLRINDSYGSIFIDGVLANTTSWAGSAFNPNSRHLCIGRYGDYNGYYLNGHIDEVILWNRSLSDSEVASISVNPPPMLGGGSEQENSPYSGSCSSVNYVGGLAVSCND